MKPHGSAYVRNIGAAGSQPHRADDLDRGMVDPKIAVAMPVENYEEQLRLAMLHGSVPELDELLSDDLDETIPFCVIGSGRSSQTTSAA